MAVTKLSYPILVLYVLVLHCWPDYLLSDCHYCCLGSFNCFLYYGMCQTLLRCHFYSFYWDCLTSSGCLFSSLPYLRIFPCYFWKHVMLLTLKANNYTGCFCAIYSMCKAWSMYKHIHLQECTYIYGDGIFRWRDYRYESVCYWHGVLLVDCLLSVVFLYADII